MFGDAWSGVTNNFPQVSTNSIRTFTHPSSSLFEGRCTDLHDLSGNGRLEGCIVVGKVRESMLVADR